MPTILRHYITTHGAALVAHVDRKTITNAIDAADLPAEDIRATIPGSVPYWLIKRTDLHRWIARRTRRKSKRRA